MKIEIIEKKENPLFKRTDVRFRVDHADGPTPKRLDVHAQLAAQLGVSGDLVVIEKLASTRGRQVASGIARTYNSREQLESIEPEYLLKRGMPKEAKAEAKPEEKSHEKKTEKPKEAQKPEKTEEKKAEKPPEKPAEVAKEVKEKPKEGGEGVKES